MLTEILYAWEDCTPRDRCLVVVGMTLFITGLIMAMAV